jgi:phospholipid/cholesterol/gamma-HCH transport system ATP-binding protein
MTAVPKLRLAALRKAFGPKQVLDGVDLEVPRGSSMVILGGSGSGKSVTVKCVLGLIEPDGGTIEVDGRDLSAMTRAERKAVLDRTGMLFQNGALFDSLPVWENVCFKLLAQKRISRRAARDKAAEVLALVGLAPEVCDLWPAELSGGMQRVALARAIAAEPDLLFFDEPTTGLDPIMGAVIDGLIVDVVKRLGATAVSITHDMASARRIGDRAAMIHKGRIVWTGDAKTLGATGNALVDQFARGEREGPITMELRR